MSRPNVTTPENAQIFRTDRIILDTNVWWFLEGTAFLPPRQNAEQERIDQYSSAYHHLLNVHKCEILIPQVVLSEFINLAISRTQQQAANERDRNNLKQFRLTPAYGQCMEDIALALTNIFQSAKQVNFTFSNYQPERIAEDLKRAKLDYTDMVISHLCHTEDIILLTDDADFAECGLPIEILTYNRNCFR